MTTPHQFIEQRAVARIRALAERGFSHTPGPWTLQPIGDETECNILGAGRELVATVSDNDARLIALAPEMADVLRDCVESLSKLPNTEGAYRVTCLTQARALLARLAP